MEDFQSLIKKDLYQVFLFACPATVPFMFARHPWFVVNHKGIISRWEILWQAEQRRPCWGHLHKDFLPPFQGIEMFFYSEKYFFKSRMLGSLGGNEVSLAGRMADFIEASPHTYPDSYQYRLLGPNSNTYAQWVLDHFPEAEWRLPWNAFGKSG